MRVERARFDDLPEVRRLLTDHDLPVDDVEQHVGTMVVAREGNRTVGAAALEVYAEGGLLRSVVVDRAHHSQGIGGRVTNAALQLASEHRLPAVFLLTTTAERFFPRFGFEVISRAEVPPSVQASVEFRSACPASAIVMRKRLVTPVLP